MNSAAGELLDGTPERVLLLVATRRDAEVTGSLLHSVGVDSRACRSLGEILEEIPRGAGALLLTEEALHGPSAFELLRLLKRQATWSDLPVIVMMKSGAPASFIEELLAGFTNVTVLDRPTPMRTLVGAIESALRERRRQYQIRDQLEAVRSAEARAVQLQQQLESALDASDVGTFYVDLPPRALICDDRCRRHLGLTGSGPLLLRQALRTVLREDRPAVAAAAHASAEGDGPLVAEFRIRRPFGGVIRWVRVQGRVIYASAGVPTRFVGTTLDMTSRRQMEDERARLLRQEQAARAEAERANRLKDEFLATLSHELRTPLNAIAGWVELLKQAPDDVPSVLDAAAAIYRSVRAQSELIEDLLDVSRIISGKVRLEFRSLTLPEVVEAALETIRPTAEAKGLHLSAQADPDLPRITGDPARLQQIVWNLLSNAAKFTPSGGSIRVTLRRQRDHVVLSVADTGEGIAAEFLPRMFERFSQADSSSTRRHGGLGLGLSIVKGLTELHGGQVTVSSSGVGQGSTFTVRLPVRAAAADPVPPAPRRGSAATYVATRHADLRGVRVLVVDDEPEGREVIRRLLAGCGATPFVAASVAEAWALLAAELPHVIVSDIGMPGTDGYQFVRDLRQQQISTPAIALTAFARSEDITRAHAAGYQAHLPKPVEPARLLMHVAQLAQANAGGASADAALHAIAQPPAV